MISEIWFFHHFLKWLLSVISYTFTFENFYCELMLNLAVQLEWQSKDNKRFAVMQDVYVYM